MGRNKKQVEIKAGGLGDVIENIAESTGIKKLVQIFVNGEDCGCDKRKEKINELFPFKFKARCFTETEYNDWKTFVETRTIRLEWEQVKYVCELYASIFDRPVWYPCTSCSPKPLIGMIDKLDKVYETYE
jgi:hypothetical protein